ncbi:MAG: protein O-mannosyl-transferase family [Rubrobacter sp.]
MLAGGLAVFVVFSLYVRTLAPTVLYYDRPILLDSAMLQVQAIVLGIPGGTGSPSWVMLTHLFTYLPFGDPAYRTNLASAAYASGAVALVYAAGYLLGRSVAAAAVGALAFGFGTTLWSQAVVAEVYTLNALMVMSSVTALIFWHRSRRDRYLLLGCLLMGLSLTNHITSGLVLPGALLLVALTDWRKFLDFRLVLKGAGLFVVGLSPYLYLPIRASMNPPLNEWEPTNFERFWYLVSGGDHHINSFAFGPAEIPGRSMLYLDFLLQNFHWGVVLIAVVGAALLIERRETRAVGVVVGALWLGWTFHAIEYNIFDFNLYFITSYLMVSVAFAYGVAELLYAARALVENRSRGLGLAAALVLGVGFALLAGVKMPGAYAENDMSEDYRGRAVIDAVAEGAAPNSTVLHHRSSLWYMVLVEKRRTDLMLIAPLPPDRQRYTDIVWPDDLDYVTTNLRYGTNDETGVTTAKIAAREGPVYILNEDSAAPWNFTDAGFDIIHARSDILYKLVPPGGTRYTLTDEESGEEPEVEASEE